MHSNFKGLVLAAGFGTRLRPLTNLYAKPLVPFLGTTPLELALWRLGAAGVKDIAINSHYFSEQIAGFVRENRHSLKLLASIGLAVTPGIGESINDKNSLFKRFSDDDMSFLVNRKS
jgi:NDP-sugar pyrophosphorylase family protein